jgi:aspartyl-tRNA synthetase
MMLTPSVTQGLDFEMQIYEHYFEVLDVIEKLFEHIFNGLATRFGKTHSCSAPALIVLILLQYCFAGKELSVISQQYPFELPVFKPLRLTFPEGIAMLQESGYPDVSCNSTSLSLLHASL